MTPGRFIQIVVFILFFPTVGLTHPKKETSEVLELEQIFEQILKESEHVTESETPTISILNSNYPNAFVKDGEIVISSGLLELTDSRSEEAFVIAHELAHVLLKHGDSALSGTQEAEITREMEADQLALELLEGAGYSVEGSVVILGRLSAYGKEQGISLGELHPSLKFRIESIQQTKK